MNTDPFSARGLNNKDNVEIKQPNMAILLLPNLLHKALATGPTKQCHEHMRQKEMQFWLNYSTVQV